MAAQLLHKMSENVNSLISSAEEIIEDLRRMMSWFDTDNLIKACILAVQLCTESHLRCYRQWRERSAWAAVIAASGLSACVEFDIPAGNYKAITEYAVVDDITQCDKSLCILVGGDAGADAIAEFRRAVEVFKSVVALVLGTTSREAHVVKIASLLPRLATSPTYGDCFDCDRVSAILSTFGKPDSYLAIVSNTTRGGSDMIIGLPEGPPFAPPFVTVNWVGGTATPVGSCAYNPRDIVKLADNVADQYLEDPKSPSYCKKCDMIVKFVAYKK